MERNIEDVIRSQNKMLKKLGKHPKMNHIQLADSFEKHNCRVKAWLKEKGFKFICIQYEEVLSLPFYEAKKITDFLKLPLHIDKMMDSVSLHG